MAFPSNEDELRAFILETVGTQPVLPLARGIGSPEGVVVADIGVIYERSDGGAGTSVYVKEANAGQNTGWVAK